ncbi:preprotein translocase subunit SecA [Hyphobacterium sp. CCMP332]|nr:preprotein translocase subunit SecA [Hyphobacterium sp. CCMP332]
MINLITKGLSKIFGTKSERDIKEILPLVEKINEEYSKLDKLSHDELRGETEKLRSYLEKALSGIDKQIEDLKQKVADNPDLGIHEKEDIFNQVDGLEEKRFEALEKELLEILPKAFAIVKETANRFKSNETIKVKASFFDKQIAQNNDYVSVEGDYALWSNSWEAAGNRITWDMLHYDVQLIGGIVLHQGKIAEMATGEGKTLVATLPAFLNALSKRGVHIVTVNDYLARRDSEWMGPIFEFHGMSVDCIDKHEPHSDGRKKAYNSDIAYGTNNEFGFDYLRDNMSRNPEDLVQRKLHYAMVDEVDSVLVDDARTPLIISGPVPESEAKHEFHELKPRIAKLVDAQRKLVSDYLNQAKKSIKENNEKEGGLPLFRTYRGMPKYKPLIKFLSETGMRQILQKTENFYLQDNSKMMPEADEPLYFTIDEKNNNIELTEKGIDLITGEGEDASFFILPDIAIEIGNIENADDLDPKEKAKQKEKLIKDYGEKTKRIHTINQLLKAYTLFEKDVEYIIQENKIMIVDEQTGRVMDGRRYSDGLHQAIEAKENVKVEKATQTYATVTLQNYFRMYNKLSGMTGTAETEAGEFWEIYKLDVVVIPTNVPIVRDDRQDKVFKTVREKYNAVIDEISELADAGRPILVGTTSVENSEIISRMLKLRNIKHQVLNAKQHQKEAEVVAEAGKPSTVTIATNMAGRGTDIKLTPESKQAGGLAIVGTERHESRRVDRQLRGRAGRQGDPGSSQFFVSLEDNLMRLFGSDRIARVMDRLGLEEGEVIQHSMVSSSIERAQKKVEENNFGIRKRLLEYDDVMNSQREVIYSRRKNALFGERLAFDIMNMIYDISEELIISYGGSENYEGFKLDCITLLSIDPSISEDELKKANLPELTEKLYDQAYSHYLEKNKQIAEKTFPVIKDVFDTKGATVENIVVPFTDGNKQIQVVSNLKQAVNTKNKDLVLSLEKFSTLAIIDQAWKEHLREMDDLKQSVQGAVYEQKDPLLIYKFEAFELFKAFLSRINREISSFLLKADLPKESAQDVREAREVRRRQEKLNTKKEEAGSLLSGGGGQANRTQAPSITAPVKSKKVAGRNDRVTVQYADGSIKKDVKFKTVEQDVLNNKCVLLEN